MWVDTLWGTLLLKFDTLRELAQLRSKMFQTTLVSPKSSKRNVSKSKSDCFQILYRGEVPEAT